MARSNRFWDKRFWAPITQGDFFCSDNFFYGRAAVTEKATVAGLLNSTFHFLQIEIMGRANQGQGVLNTYGPDFRFIQSVDSNLIDGKAMKKALEYLARRPVLDIFEEIKQEDRKALDNIVFDVLELSVSERQAVYDAMTDMVRRRLKKAGSV